MTKPTTELLTTERLKEMLERQLAGYLTITTSEITSMLTELLASRTSHATEAVAWWHHELRDEVGHRIDEDVTRTDAHPFGRQGRDFDDDYSVITRPLYATPQPVAVKVTDGMVERAARGIYDEGPSIGQDCECGWNDQTPQYKQKARMIARAALTAALSGDAS